MKKGPLKEFIISSVAAAVAGFVVKKGYDLFQENELPKIQEVKKPLKDRSVFDKAKSLVNQGVNKAESLKDDNPAQQGLVATIAYAVTVFTVSKLLRKVI